MMHLKVQYIYICVIIITNQHYPSRAKLVFELLGPQVESVCGALSSQPCKIRPPDILEPQTPGCDCELFRIPFIRTPIRLVIHVPLSKGKASKEGILQ